MKIDRKQQRPWLVMELKKNVKYSDMHSIVHCCIIIMNSTTKHQATVFISNKYIYKKKCNDKRLQKEKHSKYFRHLKWK